MVAGVELLVDIVINADCCPDNAKGVDIYFVTNVFSFNHQEENDNQREHEDSLIPAESAGDEMVGVGVYKRADG